MPTRTITGSIWDDMVYVDKVIGVKVALAKRGGHIDLTSGGAWLNNIAERIRYALSKGVSISLLTISSDGNGSMP